MKSAIETWSRDLATVTVTYQPNLESLRGQFQRLPTDALRIIVDNASENVEGLRRFAHEHTALLIENDINRGLASATNQGIELAREHNCARVLFLDQDTEPHAGAVAELVLAYQRLQASGRPVGCIGPRLIDAATNLDHGFHCIRGWRWIRVYPAAGEAVDCANLNGSGTLVPAEVLDRLGGLEDDLFIDHVDTEWAFRVRAAGFGLYGAPTAVFRHRMGERTWTYWWWGRRTWPYRSPIRHRYLFRNALRLIRRDYVPRVWKAWVLVKLFMTLCVHIVFDRARCKQVSAMVRGLLEGLREAPHRETP